MFILSEVNGIRGHIFKYNNSEIYLKELQFVIESLLD